MSLLQCIGRELTNAFVHDARRAIFLFGAAAAYLILFGILYYPGVVKDIPTVICDESHTAYSRNILRIRTVFLWSASYPMRKKHDR